MAEAGARPSGRRRPARLLRRPARAAGGTGGPCCTRRTRRGTSPTWSSGRAWHRWSTPTRLVATLLAFFLAVGLAAHALDELHGRRCGPRIPRAPGGRHRRRAGRGRRARRRRHRPRSGAALVPFLVVGPLLVIGLQLRALRRGRPQRRRLRRQLGRLPRAHRLRGPDRPAGRGPVMAACGAFALSARSAPSARRPGSCGAGRRASRGRSRCPTAAVPCRPRHILGPLERALRSLSWAMVLIAAALAVARLD